jgi:hypothetical protein
VRAGHELEQGGLAAGGNTDQRRAKHELRRLALSHLFQHRTYGESKARKYRFVSGLGIDITSAATYYPCGF